jgi:sugar lactone lactonase YvrE
MAPAPRLRAALAVLSLALLAGCAHAPPSEAAPRVEPVVWPEPPAAPRARLALVLSSPLGTPAKPSFWQRAWRGLVGLDEESEQDTRFRRPFGVAPLSDGGVVVADPDATLVVRLRAGEPSQTLACPDHPWTAPLGVAATDRGEVWIADAGEGVVVRIAADGRCTRLGAGALERPTSVAVRDGRVYVADPPRHQIAVFRETGEPAGTIGRWGDGDGELNFPTSVAFAPSGELLVVDALHFRIARFDADGRWLGAFGAAMAEGGEFGMPKDVTADRDGRVYVSDAQRDAVLVFRPDGTFDYALGASGDEPGHFTHPAGVASSGDRVYVADSYAGRVQAFDILGAPR